MADRLVIHPLNRGIRPVRIELQIQEGKVASAKVGMTYYWDFAKTLRGKDPLDAIQLTQRSSGLDFVSHAAAAVRAMEQIARIEVPVYAEIARNILLALDMVYGHITHFYQNILPDYIPFPGIGPFYTVAGDFRINPVLVNSMIKNMWHAFEIRELIHQMMALVGGKVPHICNVVFGGVTKPVNGADIIRMRSLLKKISRFVNDEYNSDLELIEKNYPEYWEIGGGAGDFLSVGEFPQKKPMNYWFSSGVVTDRKKTELDPTLISMDYTGSWFEADSRVANPLIVVLEPAPDKQGGYSWVKGAVYGENTYEVGAPARMILSENNSIAGPGTRVASVLGRYRSRLEESKKLVQEMFLWLEQINPGDNPAEAAVMPKNGEAIGAAEGSQGSVLHYLSIKNGRIHTYNVLDYFSWNLCPGSAKGKLGPVERALLNLNSMGSIISSEILRVARSF